MRDGIRMRGTRLLAMVLVFLLIVPTAGYALNPQPEPPLPAISVLINGSPLTMDVLPIIKDGRTLVPLRAIFESLGAEVLWNATERSVTAKKGNTTVLLQIGNTQAVVTYVLPKWSPDFSQTSGTATNVMSIALDVPPQIVESRTLVPVRFVSEALGSKVSWNGTTHTVCVDMAAPSGMAVPDVSGTYYGLVTQKRPESKELPKDQRRGTVLVLVNQDIYPMIKPSVETYANDLVEEGYAADVYTATGGDGVQLKQFIRKWWLGVLGACISDKITYDAVNYGSGVVMIGDVAVPWVHMRTGMNPDDSNKPYDGTFICELYLADMDGTWETLEDQGSPFISCADPQVMPADSECLPGDMDASQFQTAVPNSGQGGARPELWLGRIAPSPLAYGSDGKIDRTKEVQYLKAYFERNHAYRHSQFPYVTQGVDPEAVAAKNRLFYWDEDWLSKAETYVKSLQYSFPGPLVEDLVPSPPNAYTRYVRSASLTTTTAYKALMQKSPYIWVEALAHSGPVVHEFGRHEKQWDGTWKWISEGYLYAGNVLNDNYRGLFYQVQGCAACKYTEKSNIGTAYLFADDGLVVVGNTTAGAHDQATLHVMLAKGMNVGQALMMSQRLHLKAGWVASEPFNAANAQPKRYYQQVLLGDPTLRPMIFTPKMAPVSATKQPDMGVLSPNIPDAAKGAQDKYSLSTLSGSRLAAESPLALRRYTGPLASGSRYLPTDPSKIVIDPDHYRFLQMQLLPVAPPIIPVTPTYTLTLAPATQSITIGTTVAFAGKLTSSTGVTAPTPAAGKTIRLYELVASPTTRLTTRSLVGTGVTGSDGTYTIPYAPVRSGTFIAVFHNADGSDAAVSNNSVMTLVSRLIIP